MKTVVIAVALAASACANVDAGEDANEGSDEPSTTQVESLGEADASVAAEAELGQRKRFIDPNGGGGKHTVCTYEDDANYRCTTCTEYTDGVAGSPWTTCRPKPKKKPTKVAR